MKEVFFHPESAEIVKALDEIARRHSGRERVFDDFLTMTVCALAGGTREEEYLATVQPYCAGEKAMREADRIAALFARLVEVMDETRMDILGDVFQAAITRGQNGQYLTPDPLCELMAQMTGAEGETVSDPCCGSGRLLLAAARQNRNRYFVGQDIDHRCVKITAINLALWNLYGRVIWGNTLTNEVRRVYHTGFNGTGVIRVEEPTAPAPSGPCMPPEGVPPPGSDPAPEPSEPRPPRQRSLFDEETS